MMRWIAFLLLIAVVAGLAYVRFAPVDQARWLTVKYPKLAPGEYAGAGKFTAQFLFEGDGKAELERLHNVVTATSRTRVVSGSLGQGQIAYETRSAVLGFPDYTTVSLTQLPLEGKSTLQIFARLRFGSYDFGVNKARVKGWVLRADLK